MPNIRHSVLIGASPEKVYRAITSQEGLAAWWTPEATATPTPGSVARFPFGPDYFKEMKITDLQPSRQVTWNCISGAKEWIGTTLSFTLEAGDKSSLSKSHPEMAGQVQQQKDTEKATLLIFHHDNWAADTPMFAECNYTWGQFLRSLKLFCETGKGLPWPHQHSV